MNTSTITTITTKLWGESETTETTPSCHSNYHHYYYVISSHVLIGPQTGVVWCVQTYIPNPVHFPATTTYARQQWRHTKTLVEHNNNTITHVSKLPNENNCEYQPREMIMMDVWSEFFFSEHVKSITIYILKGKHRWKAENCMSRIFFYLAFIFLLCRLPPSLINIAPNYLGCLAITLFTLTN